MALDFPSNPVDGQIVGNFYWDSSMSAWRATGSISATVPSGVVSQYMGAVAPSGYLLCDGSSKLVSDYPALFAVIGYNYGGSGSNFTLPDMRGRVPVGKAASGIFNVSLNSSAIGGAETVILDSTQIPSHTHTVLDPGHNHLQNSHNHTQDAHNHNFSYSGGEYSGWPLSTTSGGNVTLYVGNNAGYNPVGIANRTATNQPTTATNNANTTGISVTGQAGTTGQAHNNLQPYIVVNYIIKT